MISLELIGAAAVLAVGAVLGGLVTIVLWRTRLLIQAVGAGLLLAGLTGLGLAVGGGAVGLTADQRGGMGIVAVTLGGMGLLMTIAVIRDRRRGRPRRP